MPDFLDEVISDVKQDRVRLVFEKHGNKLVGLIISIILISSGFIWYENYTISKKIETGDKFFVSSKPNMNQDEILLALEGVIESGSKGYSLAAQANKAKVLILQGKIDGAVEVYDKVAKSSRDKILRDFALLQKSVLQIENGALEDGVAVDAIKQQLSELSELERPFSYSAKEVLAVIHKRIGQTEDASKIYESIQNDVLAPQRLRERATIMLSAINNQ